MFYWILYRIPSKRLLSCEDREVKAAYKNVQEQNSSATCSLVSLLTELQEKVNQFPFCFCFHALVSIEMAQTHTSCSFHVQSQSNRRTVEPTNTRGLLVFNKASSSFPCQWHIASLTLLALCILTAFSKWQRVKVFFAACYAPKGLKQTINPKPSVW